MEKKIDFKNKKTKYIICGVIAVIAVVLIGIHMYYSNRWYPGSKIDGVSVSGMTYEQSIKKVENTVSSYKLTVSARKKGQLVIKGEDIELTLTRKDRIKNLFDQQHKSTVLTAWTTSNDKKITNILSFSQKALTRLVKNSSLIKGDENYQITKPVDATIVYSESKKYGVIQEEVDGNLLDQEMFLSYLKEEIDSLSDKMNLTDTDTYKNVYKEPGLRKEDQELKTMQETYNQYLLHWIQWDMGNNVTETLGPETLKDCIYVNTKRHTVKLRQSVVEKWLEEFCLKYKTQGITRKFKTHSGKTIKISGGDYGWRIDYDQEVKKAMRILKKAADESAISAYMKDTSTKNQEALTSTLKPTYSHEGYQMDYEKKQNDWDTKNYSEVDLSNQEVYVYRNGKLVFSCICITGKNTPDRITRTGVYDIKEKKLTKTLTGADYSVETKYWTRIMWTGTGYHYSARGDWGSWSPSYWKTNGSHGCVNLTLSNAESIYNLTKIGDPVFIHY